MTKKEKFFALRRQHDGALTCQAHTLSEFNNKLDHAYLGWQANTPKITGRSIEKFMKGRDKVLVTIEVLE